MFDIHRVELDWGGRKLTLETGKVARQADGAVVATYGETTVLATVVASKQPKPGVDFLPLTVNYQEKFYAAGRIPGGYFKREGRPTEKETLTSRLIDRPVRPLFADGWRCDTQVIINTLSHDLENDPDIVAMVAASAALTLSGAPFMGPIGGARVGFINNEYVLNPQIDEMAESQLDLVVAGTQDAVLMVELEAKELSEDIMLGAVMFGHRHFQPVIDAIIRLAEKAAKEPRDFAMPDNSAIEKEMLGVVEQDLRKAYAIPDKMQRHDAVDAAKKKAMEHFFPGGADNPERPMTQVAGVFKDLEAKIVRWNILDTGQRIDGRDVKTVRPIVAEAGVLPRTHGSALFTRGETQALVVATLGTGEDEQWVDALQGTYKETFMLHYNFPPFSVGETGRIGAPGRREIGHGKLAWRAIHPVLPVKDDFPYTIRVVSEITEFERFVVDGDGVRHIARADGRRRAAQARHRGHRDGADQGRAALRGALRHPRRRGSSRRHGLQGSRHRARRHLAADGHQDRRHHRGDHADRARPGQGRPHAHPGRDGAVRCTVARAELGEYAPRIETFKIATDKIREVIGTGGKVIREIVEKTGAKIDIQDDGTVKVASANNESIKAAVNWIKSIASDPEIGHIYEGTVVKVMDFGAFVNFFGAKDGLVHISQLAPQRVQKTGDVVKEGDKVKVKLLGFDERGKVRLSMKVVDQQTGEDLEARQKVERDQQQQAAAGE